MLFRSTARSMFAVGLAALVLAIPLAAAVPAATAFASAVYEGFGASTPGGSGKPTYHVTAGSGWRSRFPRSSGRSTTRPGPSRGAVPRTRGRRRISRDAARHRRGSRHPAGVYVDRHGIFTKRATEHLTLEEELTGTRLPTQVGRSLDELWIRRIHARSAEGKGRIGRM